jgi:hypothetical protein
MDSANPRRTLVVADRTAQTPLRLEEIGRRAAERPTVFALLIPNVSSRMGADWTLESALKVLRRAARGPTGQRSAQVDGLVGGADAFESIKQALAERDYDDVIISTLPKRTSEWLRRDLPRRVEKLNLPVTVITTEPEDEPSLYSRYNSPSVTTADGQHVHPLTPPRA